MTDVPVYRVVQRPGEIIITFPRCYHGGFSHGFNVGEAVNLALPEWFSFGKQAVAQYAQISAARILPHEQLLCQEAVSVGGLGTEFSGEYAAVFHCTLFIFGGCNNPK